MTENCIDWLLWVESFNYKNQVDYEIQIVRHADMSVDPGWIGPIWTRLEDAKKRYSTRPWAQEPAFWEIYNQAHTCQSLLFWKTTIQPLEITNESTQSIQSILWKYDLPIWT